MNGAGDVEGIIEVGGGAALLVRHAPPAVVGYEGVAVEDGEGLDIVVALGDHPRAFAGVRLDEASEGVPQRLLRVCVREIPGEEEHVVVRLRDMRQRRRRPFRLPEITCRQRSSARTSLVATITSVEPMTANSMGRAAGGVLKLNSWSIPPQR